MATNPTEAKGAQLTKMQELTSAWFFRQALKNNKSYASAREAMESKEFRDDILGTKSKPGIYPSIDKDWLETFIKQQGRYIEEFTQVKFKEFSVDGGFMDWVSKLVNTKYKIGKKDAWDPADVWCIQNENEVKKQIENAIKNTVDIEVLNAQLRTLFEERKVVGISLKKVSSKSTKAKYQEVNVKEGILFTSGKHPTFEIVEIKCDLKLQNDNTIKNAGCEIIFKINYTKDILTNTLTIRSTGRTYRPGNQTFIITEKGAAAHIGKVPQPLLKDVCKRHKLPFDNEWNNFPASAKDFNTEIADWKGMFDEIKNEVTTNVKTSEEFTSSILTLMMDKDNYGIANSKLIQINFLFNLMQLSKDTREKFITDLFFLAEKRGQGFGPFGKIY